VLFIFEFSIFSMQQPGTEVRLETCPCQKHQARRDGVESCRKWRHIVSVHSSIELLGLMWFLTMLLVLGNAHTTTIYIFLLQNVLQISCLGTGTGGWPSRESRRACVPPAYSKSRHADCTCGEVSMCKDGRALISLFPVFWKQGQGHRLAAACLLSSWRAPVTLRLRLHRTCCSLTAFYTHSTPCSDYASIKQ
jgi:hypothetical protein